MNSNCDGSSPRRMGGRVAPATIREAGRVLRRGSRGEARQGTEGKDLAQVKGHGSSSSERWRRRASTEWRKLEIFVGRGERTVFIPNKV